MCGLVAEEHSQVRMTRCCRRSKGKGGARWTRCATIVNGTALCKVNIFIVRRPSKFPVQKMSFFCPFGGSRLSSLVYCKLSKEWRGFYGMAVARSAKILRNGGKAQEGRTAFCEIARSLLTPTTPVNGYVCIPSRRATALDVVMVHLPTISARDWVAL